MSFTDGTPQTVTEKHLRLPWSGDPKNFRCTLCGHAFKVGDIFRFFRGYLYNRPNFLVCVACDNEDEIIATRYDEAKKEYEQTAGKFWWFFKREQRS